MNSRAGQTAFSKEVGPRAVHDICLQVSVGAGGAIIILSDVDEEYEEMQLKAASVTSSFTGFA